jgi:hypothetical protein
VKGDVGGDFGEGWAIGFWGICKEYDRLDVEGDAGGDAVAHGSAICQVISTEGEHDDDCGSWRNLRVEFA